MALPTLSQLLSTLAVPTHLTPDEQLCPICLVKYGQDHEPVILHKRHIYCTTCLAQWLSEATHCPLCREEVISKPLPPLSRLSAPVFYDRTSLYHLTGPSAQYYSQALRHGELSMLSAYADMYLIDVRQRLNRYASHQLVMDTAYGFVHPTTREVPQLTMGEGEEVSQGEDPVGHEVDRPLNATTLIILIWERLVSELSAVPDDDREFSSWQHPLTSAYVLEIFSALKRWNGDVKSAAMLRLCLGMRLNAWERTVYPEGEFPRPAGWEWIKRSIVEGLVGLHASELDGDTKTKVQALVGCHQGLLGE